MLGLDGLPPTVWCIVRHADSGAQQVYEVCMTQAQAEEAIAALDVDDLQSYWWTLREHAIGEVIR